MSCSTSSRVSFILTQPELYAIKISKKYFADLCSKLTLIDVFGHSRVFSTVSSWNNVYWPDVNVFRMYYCIGWPRVSSWNNVYWPDINVFRMYYCIGWPRVARLPQENPGSPVRVSCNRDRILVAVLTTDSVIIWYNKVSTI